ncbi:MAG: carbohydrate ABC transporter permease [Phycisphaerae bacterium]
MSSSSAAAATLDLREGRTDWAGYLFILPNFLGFLAFSFLPIFVSLALAFMRCSLLDEPRFVGLQNFRAILTDPKFWKYAWNTVFLMFGIPLNITASLILALLLDRKRRGVVLFRTIYFLPTVASGVAVFILWTWVLRADAGLLNNLLARVGLAGPNWLNDPAWIKPGMVLVGLWISAGGINMLLYLAALQNVPQELYEAAQIDGAGARAQFFHITWPLIWPTTFFILIMALIAGFQGGFDMVYVMTDGSGGPGGAAVTIDFHIYQNAYVNLKLGYASAIAWLLFVAVLFFTLIAWRFGARRAQF